MFPPVKTPNVHRSTLTRQRLVLVFLAGLLFFFSPILSLFDRQADWHGVPVLYLYLFGVWAVLIAVTAWIAGSGDE